MKKLLLVILFFVFLGVNFAQTALFVEEFNYAAGDLLTAHNWVQSGSTSSNPVAVSSTGLSFSNYASVAGKACVLNTSGQDVYYTFTPVSSGSVYLSFLLNVQTSGTGDYFIALSPATQTNYTARVFVKTNGTGYSLGLSKTNENSAGAIYGNTVLNFNTTYLVVVKYKFNTGSNLDDAISVFVYSNITVGTQEPSTAEILAYTFSSDPLKTDAPTIESVTLRQGSTSAGVSPALTIDGIRISSSWNLSIFATDVTENNSEIPAKFDLMQNYPNPFNPSTLIKYQVPQNTHVNISVYDILGNKISTLVNQEKAAGSYEVTFSADDMPSGVYFYTIQTGSFTQTKKMILMK